MTLFSLHLSLRNLLENLGFNEPLLATLAHESPQDFFDVLNSEALRTEIGGLPDLSLLHQPELLALRLRLRAAGPRLAQRATISPLVPCVSAAPTYSSTTSSTSASPSYYLFPSCSGVDEALQVSTDDYEHHHLRAPMGATAPDVLVTTSRGHQSNTRLRPWPCRPLSSPTQTSKSWS